MIAFRAWIALRRLALLPRVLGPSRIRRGLIAIMCAMLAGTAGAAVGAAPPLPRIAVISIELAQQPAAMREAVARQRDRLRIDLFGLGGGYLPGLDGVDLDGYDLVLVEGVGPRLAQYRGRLAQAARHTRVLVLNGTEWVDGNVPIAAVPDAPRYWANATAENYARLFDYLAARLLGRSVTPQPPVIYPDQAFYHPRHAGVFDTLDGYLAWAAQRHRDAPSRPRVGLVFYRSLALGGNTAVVDALIEEVERQGGLPVPMWRSNSQVPLRHLEDARGRPAIDVLVLCASQIDYADHAAGVAQARRLGVAVLNCTTDYARTPGQWRADPGGFAPDRSGQLAMSEASGIVEPMMVGAREPDAQGMPAHVPLAGQVAWRVSRALAWARLHRLPNADKRLVIAYHSESGDPGDVGSDPDTYLDAQASLSALLARLRAEGYDLGPGELPGAHELARRMAEDASNASGPGAAAELARRARQGGLVLIPESRYLAWYRTLPADLRAQTEARWGPPPGRIMVHTDAQGRRQLAIPVLRFGKVVLAPHPVWGYLQDDGALASKEALPPHHQYIAFYLWMARDLHADAYLPFFTQLSLMPGKQQGPARDDWVGTLIGDLPHIQPTPLQANGGVGNKRRAMAVTTGFMPPLVQGGLPPGLQALRDALDDAADAQAGHAQARRLAQPLARDLGLDPARAQWPELERALRRYLDEVARAVMPAGGHVLGQVPDAETKARMVHAMIAGDTEHPPALDVVRAALGGQPAGPALADGMRARIDDYARRIDQAPREMDAVVDALRGRYIEPGPMADAVRNPDALPPGRNPYTLATRRLPTRDAWETGVRLADDLVATYRREHGQPPRKVAFVLWSGESAQNQGAIEAQILRLLGVRPVWNPRGEVVDVELESRAALGRPRVDVLVTTSGTYRDHFRDKIELIAKAVALAARADEPDNAVRAASTGTIALLRSQGLPEEEARRRALRRVYSTAPGAYSPSTQFAIKAGAEWTDARLAGLYADRMSHAYGGGAEGEADGAGFGAQLDGVDAAVFSRSSNVYGLLDTPMAAAYLGGIGMAVRERTGRAVANYVADLKDPRPGQARIDDLARSYGAELQSRYFNPAWIRAMQASGYNGARYMAQLPEHLLLWDVTTPELVADADWQAVKEIYVDDKYRLGLQDYFAQHNPYARQQLIGALLDAIERGKWEAGDQVRAQLEQLLAQETAAHGAHCAQAACHARQERLALGAAPSLAGAAAPPPMDGTHATGRQPVRGFALEEKRPAPASPDAPRPLTAWLAAGFALLLVAAGAARRPRW